MKRILLPIILLGFISLGGPSAVAQIQPPKWWNGVLVGNADDNAACNLGQVKYMTIKASEAVVAAGGTLPVDLAAKVSIWGTQTQSIEQDYELIQINQLKWIASQFFFLEDLDAPDDPLSPGADFVLVVDDADDAAANLGQVKFIFSFEVTGDPNKDNDGDEVSNYHEVTILETDPTDPNVNHGVLDPDGDQLLHKIEVLIGSDPFYGYETSQNHKDQIIVLQPN